MGIFKKVFSGPETIADAMDGVKKGADAAWFTNEERAAADDAVREFFIKYLEATQPQNLARRVIAFVVTSLWALLILLAIATNWVGMGEYSLFVFDVLDEHVNFPFTTIMAFYFGAHLLRSYKKG